MALSNTKKRAKLVQELVNEHYEPGRQDRCKLWVYRNIVSKIYPMSQRTFFRLLKITSDEKKEEDKRQLKLF